MQSVTMTMSAPFEEVCVTRFTNEELNNVQDQTNRSTPYRGAVSVKMVCFMICDFATAPPVVGTLLFTKDILNVYNPAILSSISRIYKCSGIKTIIATDP